MIVQNAFVTAVTSSSFALRQAFNGLKIGVEVPGLAAIV